MERNRRWAVGPRRLIVSAVLSIGAIFVIFAAWGLGNWQLLSVGLAVLAGALALAVISAMNSRVRGVAHVISVNAPPAARYRGRVIATAVVRYKARRGSIRVMLTEDDVPLNKWPAVHDELPVVGLSSDLWNVEVLWEQVPTHQRAAARRRRADTRAAAAAEAASRDAATSGGASGSGGAAEPGLPGMTAAGAGGGSTQGGGVATAERLDTDPDATRGLRDENDIPTETRRTGDETASEPKTSSGRVVEGEWYESTPDPDLVRTEANITTEDEPPVPPREPGSKPSPRPRTAMPEGAVIGVDFGDTRSTAETEPQAEPDEPAAPARAEDAATFDFSAAASPSVGLDDLLFGPLVSGSELDEAGHAADEGPDLIFGAEEVADDVNELIDGATSGPASVFVPHQSTGPRHAAPDNDNNVAMAGPDSEPVDDGSADGGNLGGGTADEPADSPATAADVAGLRGAHHRADAEDSMFGEATSSLRTSPLQVTRAGVLPATIPAPRGDDEPYDHAYDDAAVAAGYRDALPPPGADQPGRADITVQLFVSNLSRAIIFYRDILGFTEIDAGRRAAVLDLRDVRVILKVVDDLLPSSKNVQFSLEVDDLEMAYEDLRARGVHFVHRPRRVEHYEQLEHFAAPFEDPDGHRISLSSWRSVYKSD